MTESVTVMEVSPRDGLQNEDALLDTEAKLELIERALQAGCRRIEATSFVHPKKVPQMADAEAVCAGLPQRGDVIYTGLVLNWRGLESGLEKRAANPREHVPEERSEREPFLTVHPLRRERVAP